MFADGMWIFYLEALVALSLGLFIVWWTMPKKRSSAQPSQDAAPPVDVQPVDTASASNTTGDEAPANQAPANQAAAQSASGNTARQD